MCTARAMAVRYQASGATSENPDRSASPAAPSTLPRITAISARVRLSWGLRRPWSSPPSRPLATADSMAALDQPWGISGYPAAWAGAAASEAATAADRVRAVNRLVKFNGNTPFVSCRPRRDERDEYTMVLPRGATRAGELPETCYF